MEASYPHFFIGRVLLSWTSEIYPDKKMRVGGLHDPWEYDGRLPPDAGYCLDLVIPRFDEPPKKIGSRVRLLHGRLWLIRWSIYMQSNPRISANLLVIDQFICNILPCNNLTRLPIFFRGSSFRGITRWESGKATESPKKVLKIGKNRQRMTSDTPKIRGAIWGGLL